jgi:hypothetical protein
VLSFGMGGFECRRELKRILYTCIKKKEKKNLLGSNDKLSFGTGTHPPPLCRSSHAECSQIFYCNNVGGGKVGKGKVLAKKQVYARPSLVPAIAGKVINTM